MKIGEKLKELRLQRNLTQGELAARCELSKGFISQVERDLASPSITTLADLLECLGTTLHAFFAEDSKEKIVFSPQDMFEKDDCGNGKIIWLVPDAQKNRMEPIVLQLKPGCFSHQMPPHEGEEFGYVLHGQIRLYAGKQKYTVKRGYSFCLHPATPHYLENTGKTLASVLWISTPPSF